MTSPLIIESRPETSCPGAVRAFKRSLGVEPIGLLPFTYASERCTKLVSLSACEKFHARDRAGEPTGQNRLTFPEIKTDATRRDATIPPNLENVAVYLVNSLVVEMQMQLLAYKRVDECSKRSQVIVEDPIFFSSIALVTERSTYVSDPYRQRLTSLDKMLQLRRAFVTSSLDLSILSK